MERIEIHAYEDGPYVVTGRLTRVTPEERSKGQPGTAVALCRCSHSRRLPFCDGAHKAAGFRAPETRLELSPQDDAS